MDYSQLLKICCQDNKLDDKNIELIVNKSLNVSFDEFKLVIENYILHDYPNLQSKINLLINKRIRIQEKSNCIINKEFNSLDISTTFYEELIQVLELFDEKELIDIVVLNLQEGCSIKIINGLNKLPNLMDYWISNNIIESFELPIGIYLGELSLSNLNIKSLPDNFVDRINNYNLKPESYSTMSIFLDGNPLLNNDILWENEIKVYEILNRYKKISNKENEEDHIYFRIKTNNTYPENKTNLVFDEVTDNGFGIIYHPNSSKSILSINNDKVINKAIVDNKNTNNWNWKSYLFWFLIIYLCYKWFKN
jgi:hypothetical protein